MSTNTEVIGAAATLSDHAATLTRHLLDGGQVLDQVGDAYTVVGHLASALSRLVSSVRELDEWAMAAADGDPTLRHDQGTHHDAAVALITAAAHFETAAGGLDEVAGALHEAQASLGPVGHGIQGVDQ